MSKKLTIFIALVLIAAAGALGWARYDQQNQQRLMEKHQEIFESGTEQILEKTAAADANLPYSELITTEQHREQLADYRQRAELREMVVTIAIVAFACAAAVIIIALIKPLVISAVKALASLKISLARIYNSRLESAAAEQQLEDADEDYSPGLETVHDNDPEDAPADHDQPEPQHQPEKPKQKTAPKAFSPTDGAFWDRGFGGYSAGKARHIEKLLAYEGNFQQDSDNTHSATATKTKPAARKAEKQSGKKTRRGNSPMGADSLRAQTEDLQKQLAEFRKLTTGLKQTTQKESSPQIENTLTDLVQQVSAIREYASNQQERVSKLQDGYDWSIIRNFCLRIIRCIDNIESRIERLEEDSCPDYLEEVHDELVFALESSGVEQFWPEPESDYRGREKQAEAVKEKQPTENEDLKGKIARVIRPGYHYLIDQDNRKIVRTAQVKLYG